MDFSQGLLPSCQTLATVGALSRNPRGRQLLESMVSKVGDSYEVRFPTLPDCVLTVQSHEYSPSADAQLTEPFSMTAIGELSQQLAGQRCMWIVYPERPQRVSGDEIVRVLELAYAKYQQARHPQLYADLSAAHPLQVYRHAKFHYQADESLRDFTGWKVETLSAGDSPSDGRHSFEKMSAEKPELLNKVKERLVLLSDRPGDFVATACSVGSSDSKYFLDPGGKIQPWHDHVLKSVDTTKQTVEVLDPFNSRIGMVLCYEDFFRYFCLIVTAAVRA